jgi:predicted PurR-regulated permease PerM
VSEEPDRVDATKDADETETTDDADESASERRRLLGRILHRQHGEDDERLAERIANQWAAIRDVDRRRQPTPIVTGPSNFSRAQVPWGVDLAAAWAWRFLVIAVAGYAIMRVLGFFAVVTLPLVVALLITALVVPAVDRLQKVGVPRGLAAILVVLGGLAFVGALLTFAGQQVANGASDLADQTVKGLDEIRVWLRDGPLHASDSQINDWLRSAQEAITERTREGAGLSQVTEVGTAVGHVVAGFFIVLFSTYFFLADGDRIWSWLVRIAPRASRTRVDGSGRVAWRSLTQFVRATVLVALVDSIGIVIVASILGVPFVLAIGVLVFLGAFVPMIGATIAGTVAVLVALVDQGPLTALLMLGGVILVQQIEGHILQPFLMGRFVSVHPLGVIVAIACGVLLAGVAGALVAVPLAAAVNAVVQHLASRTDVGEDEPDEALEDELEEGRADAPPVPEDEGPLRD